MQSVHGVVAAFVGVPVEEGNILGGDLDETGTSLDQASCQQAAASEAAGVVLLLNLLGLEGDVEGLALLRTEEAVGVVEAAQHGLLLVVAHEIALRALIDELAEEAVAIGEARGVHALRRLHRCRGFFGEGQVHGAELAAEEAGGGEGFQFLALADAFEALADVDEGGHDRIARAEHLGHPRAKVRRGDGLRRDVAGVPMVLVAAVQDASEIGLNGAADQCGAIHDLRDVFETGADLKTVDGGVDGGEGAEHAADLEALLEGFVALRIKGVRRGHAARHPEQDAGIGLRGRMGDGLTSLRPNGARFAGHPCGRACGGELLEEVAADDGLRGRGIEIVGKLHGLKWVYRTS